MRRLSLNRSEPAKKSGQNIPKGRAPPTDARRRRRRESGAGLDRNQVPLSAEITCRFRPKSGAGLLRFLQAIGILDMGLFEADPARFEVGKHPLDTPAIRISKGGQISRFG